MQRIVLAVGWMTLGFGGLFGVGFTALVGVAWHTSRHPLPPLSAERVELPDAPPITPAVDAMPRFAAMVVAWRRKVPARSWDGLDGPELCAAYRPHVRDPLATLSRAIAAPRLLYPVQDNRGFHVIDPDDDVVRASDIGNVVVPVMLMVAADPHERTSVDGRLALVEATTHTTERMLNAEGDVFEASQQAESGFKQIARTLHDHQIFKLATDAGLRQWIQALGARDVTGPAVLATQLARRRQNIIAACADASRREDARALPPVSDSAQETARAALDRQIQLVLAGDLEKAKKESESYVAANKACWNEHGAVDEIRDVVWVLTGPLVDRWHWRVNRRVGHLFHSNDFDVYRILAAQQFGVEAFREFGPSDLSLLANSWRSAAAQRDALWLAAGIERYRRRHGRLPASLDVLNEVGISHVPADPFRPYQALTWRHGQVLSVGDDRGAMILWPPPASNDDEL